MSNGLAVIVAGLGWDPEIRGLLTVVLAAAVLGGSVWLLLVTNTGTRLGSLIALAGFFGWMFVMGIFWWIYGIGWAGSLPSWEIEDVFIDPAGAEAEGIGDAFVGNVDRLPDANCFDDDDIFPPSGGVASVALDADDDAWALCAPRAIQLVMAYPEPGRELIIRELLNPQSEESKLDNLVNAMFGIDKGDPADMLAELTDAQRNEVFDELVAMRHAEVEAAVANANERLGADDPRYLDAEGVAAAQAEAIANLNLRVDNLTLSQLEALAPDVGAWSEEAGLLRLRGWNLQSTSQSGEAAATADAFLRSELFPDGNFLVLDAFQQGGKPKRAGSDMWTRIKHEITSTARITHPTNYTVINVQQTLEKPLDPAKPPPIAEIDPEEPIYSVVMIRNLGNLRLVPALFTIASLILFLTTCLVLHWRDLGLRSKGLDV